MAVHQFRTSFFSISAPACQGKGGGKKGSFDWRGGGGNGGFGKKDGYIDRGERVDSADTADTDTVDTAVT